jgi:hypothetical protein
VVVHRPNPGHPNWNAWVAERLVIESLPDAWPTCDRRCELHHDPAAFVALVDLEVAPARPSRDGGIWWWDQPRGTTIEREPLWKATRPATEHTPTQARLLRITRLRPIARTDETWDIVAAPAWLEHEVLYEILDGPLAGGQLIAVGSGPSDLLAGLAGKMIAPDHPPARDASAAEERLAAVAGALRRGLPLEWTTPD